ncbi:MAG: TetR family transcriptional regulator [Polyangiaceae bacterium]
MAGAGRPAKFDREELLDAALALVAEGGPAALTLAALARAAGAPTGSIYHRFPRSTR